jgi:hypothetical protein
MEPLAVFDYLTICPLTRPITLIRVRCPLTLNISTPSSSTTVVRRLTVVLGSLNGITERAAFALIHSPLSIYRGSMRYTESFDEARKSMKRAPSFSVVVTDPLADVSSDVLMKGRTLAQIQGEGWGFVLGEPRKWCVHT